MNNQPPPGGPPFGQPMPTSSQPYQQQQYPQHPSHSGLPPQQQFQSVQVKMEYPQQPPPMKMEYNGPPIKMEYPQGTSVKMEMPDGGGYGGTPQSSGGSGGGGGPMRQPPPGMQHNPMQGRPYPPQMQQRPPPGQFMQQPSHMQQQNRLVHPPQSSIQGGGPPPSHSMIPPQSHPSIPPSQSSSMPSIPPPSSSSSSSQLQHPPPSQPSTSIPSSSQPSTHPIGVNQPVQVVQVNNQGPVEGVLIEKSKLDDLAREVEPSIVLEEPVKDALLEYTEEFVDDLIDRVCRLATHRGNQRLEARDVELVLDLVFQMPRVPRTTAFMSNPTAPSTSNEKNPGIVAHQQRQALIKKTLKKV